jgi:predicted dehydrogenase
LQVVCSRSANKAAAFAREFGVSEATNQLGDVLASDLVDAVYIATPHATHHELAMRCLHAGKHVLVEKPMGLNKRQVQEIFHMAASRNLVAVEAMWTTFGPTFHAVLTSIRQGDIGEVRSVQASFGIPFPRETGSRWSAEMTGSTLLDQGIYPLTLAYRLLGVPQRITSGSVVENGVDVTVHMTLHYDDGKFAQLAVSQVQFIEPSAAISGTAGWLAIDAPFWAGRKFALHTGIDLFEPDLREVEVVGNGFVPMIQAVSGIIGSGDREHPDHTAADTVAVFDLMDQVRDQFPG